MVTLSSSQPARPRRKLALALCVGLASMVVAGCASEAGPLEGRAFADAGKSVKPAGARERLVNGTPQNMLNSADLYQRVLVQTRPPKIIAKNISELPDALTYAVRASSGDTHRKRGAKWTEAAQIGLLFGSPEGKAFLSGKAGRALVRGEPAESCPVLNVALAGTDDQATEGAMRSCLNALAAKPSCGCRLMARGEHLLAKRDDFAYAIGVGTQIVSPSTGEVQTFTSEERMVEGHPGARHIWLLDVSGAKALLQVEADGRAALIVNETGKRFSGLHKSDGFRRGRVARRAYLTGEDGRQLIVLVGYEDTEVQDNNTALLAWNPYGSLELKKAEADVKE